MIFVDESNNTIKYYSQREKNDNNINRKKIAMFISQMLSNTHSTAHRMCSYRFWAPHDCNQNLNWTDVVEEISVLPISVEAS